MPNDVAAIQQAIDDTCRLIVLVQQIIANPTQANIDAVVGAVGGTNQLVPRPSYSIDGQSMQWESYRVSLINSLRGLKEALVFLDVPFMIRSRTRT